jgi:hypothetical protein
MTGTIVTNGATGVLTSADSIDWNLNVDADGIPATSGQLLGPLSGNNSAITLLGNPLTATPAAIFFAFSLPGFPTIFQIITPDSNVAWQLQASIFHDELIRESLSPALIQAYVTHPQVQEQIAALVVARFYALLPCRVADTRNAPGPSGGPPLAANSLRMFPATGTCSIPTDAAAVAIVATVVDETDVGDLRMFPTGATLPTASTINFAVNHVRANNAIVGVGTSGSISVQCDMPPSSTGTTNFLFDVYGYFK